MAEIVKATPADAGCWVDGHWGQYGAARVIEIALEHGWEDEEATDLAARHMGSMSLNPRNNDLSENDFEKLLWASEDAGRWLNENVAPEGYFFEWRDGEFFLSEEEEEEEEVTYRIVRFYRDDPDRNRTVIERGLSLEEAQAHCKDPETSSSTCTREELVEHTLAHGPWFDGYEEE